MALTTQLQRAKSFLATDSHLAKQEDGINPILTFTQIASKAHMLLCTDTELKTMQTFFYLWNEKHTKY